MSGWRWLARSAALYAQPASWLVGTPCSSVNPLSVQVVGDLTIYARTRTFPYSSMYHDPSMTTSIVYLLTVLIFPFFSRFASHFTPPTYHLNHPYMCPCPRRQLSILPSTCNAYFTTMCRSSGSVGHQGFPFFFFFLPVLRRSYENPPSTCL